MILLNFYRKREQFYDDKVQILLSLTLFVNSFIIIEQIMRITREK